MDPSTDNEFFDHTFLKALFDGMDDAVFLHPFKKEGFHRFIKVNNAACKRLEYTQEELLQLSPQDITASLDVKEHGAPTVRQELFENKWIMFETEHITKSGRTIPVEINARIFIFEEDPIIVSVVRDISKRKSIQQALERSQRKYHTLFDSINEPIYVHRFEKNKPMTFLDVNTAACDKLGYSKEELLLLSPKDIAPPHKDFDAHIEKIHHIINVSQWHIFEAFHQTKTGVIFPVEVSTRLLDVEGERALISLVRDISEKKKTEAQLKERIDLEKVIASISSRFADISDFETILKDSLKELGEFTKADRVVYYMFDEGSESAKQTHWWHKDGEIPPANMAYVLEAKKYPWWTQRMYAKEMIGIADMALLPPEAVSERKFLELMNIRSLLVVPIFTDEKFKGFLGILFTKSSGSWGALEHKLLQTCGEIIGNAVGRKVLEESHRVSERRLAESQRVARVGHYQADLRKKQWESSPMTDTLFGINSSYERTYEGWMQMIHPDFVKDVRVYMYGVIEQAVPFDIEYKIINQRTGEELWIRDRGEVKVDAQGHTVGLFGTVQDITEQMRLREAMREQEELMVAQSRHAAMGEMISMIAHQWRQPLGVISMHANNILADIAFESLETNTVKETMRAITRQTQHLSQTIDDFRDFFRPDKATAQISAQEIIDESLAVIGSTLKSVNIHVQIECPVTGVFETYSRELLQVFINVLKNAKEALVESNTTNRCIWIQVEENKTHMIFRFSDNAGGIAADAMPHIFEPYYSTKNEQTGTGLGLYMCRTIVQKHLKGSIKAYNDLNGACFILNLPKQISTSVL